MNNKLNKIVNIDSTLQNRKAINDALSILNKRKKITFDEIEKLGEMLNGMASLPVPIIIRNFLDITDEDVLMRYLFLMEYLYHEDFINPLVYTILKRDLSDGFKANVINTLYNFEVDMTSPIFSKIFQDTQNSFYTFDDKFFEDIQNNEDILVNTVEWFIWLSYQKKVAVLNRLKEIDDIRKVKLLEVIAQEKDISIALLAIDILGMSNAPEAAEALHKIIKEYKDDVRGKRAARALMKLKMLGNSLDAAPAVNDDAASCMCYISMIDGNGNYVLWVVSPEALKPPLEVLCLLINENEGFIDCFGNSEMSKREFQDIIKKAREEDYFVKIGYKLCKNLINDALYRNENTKTPLPSEFLYRKKIFKGELVPEKYARSFKEYNLKNIKDDRDLLIKTIEISTIHGVSSWCILSNEIFTYADKFLSISKNFAPSVVELKMEKLMEDIFQNLVLPELDSIKERLLFTADILQFDRKYKSYVKTLLCAVLNLSDTKGLPFRHPFMANFILMNLKNAVNARVSADKQKNDDNKS